CHRLELKAGSSVAEVPHGLSAERLTAVVGGLLLAAEQKQQDFSPTADESGKLPLIPGRTMGQNLAQIISEEGLGRGAGATRAECHRYHGGDATLRNHPFPRSTLGTHYPEAPASFVAAPVGRGGASRSSIRLVSLATAQTFVGVWSCASAGCHGEPRDGRPEWKTSFTIWAEVDPHAQAFEVLWTFRGREMTRLLSGRDEALPETEHF